MYKADGIWEKTFKVKPPVFTREERKEWLEKLENVTLGSEMCIRDSLKESHPHDIHITKEAPNYSVDE